MNLEELKYKIEQNNVPGNWYSLDDGLKPDACILYKNYAEWEYFYLDERGRKNDLKIFHKDEEAFDYLWSKLASQLRSLKK